jgi:hypothetical protein
MKEQNKNPKHRNSVMKDYLASRITRKAASLRMGVTETYVSTLKTHYLKRGKVVFTHQNTNRRNARRTDERIEANIVSYYKQGYTRFNFTHFCEYIRGTGKLYELTYGAELSDRTIARILSQAGIISPQANRAKRGTNRHPRRPRRPNFGELVQLDASQHDWFCNGSKTYLHIAIDDATSVILAGYFCSQETLTGYFELLHQVLASYGIPSAFYTDRRTIFESMTAQAQLNARTQFNNACHKLGIDIIVTSIPEAKGRVERSFRTLQDRLINELALDGVTAIDEANTFLKSYINRHNARYGLPVNFATNNAFRSLDVITGANGQRLNTILAVYETRSVLSGGLISYNNKQYMPVKADGRILTLPIDAKVQIVKTYDKRLLLLHQDTFYELRQFADGKYTGHAPPQTHPWRRWRG